MIFCILYEFWLPVKIYVNYIKNIYIKIYKHEHKGVPLSNLWTDIHSITRTVKDIRLYPTQKPQKLLERIIKLYSNENSYILDPRMWFRNDLICR